MNNSKISSTEQAQATQRNSLTQKADSFKVQSSWSVVEGSNVSLSPLQLKYLRYIVVKEIDGEHGPFKKVNFRFNPVDVDETHPDKDTIDPNKIYSFVLDYKSRKVLEDGDNVNPHTFEAYDIVHSETGKVAYVARAYKLRPVKEEQLFGFASDTIKGDGVLDNIPVPF